jgi:hypothetical protein
VEEMMSVAELEKVTKAWPPISRAVRVPHTDADYRDLVQLLDRLTDEVGEVILVVAGVSPAFDVPLSAVFDTLHYRNHEIATGRRTRYGNKSSTL